MIKKLMVITAILMISTNAYAARHVVKTAERRIARVEVTEYRNGQQTSSYSYDPRVRQPYNRYPGQPLSYSGYTGPGSNLIYYSVDPSRVIVDANGVPRIIDIDGDPRGSDNFIRFAQMLFILLPFAIIGLIPAYSDKAIFFENAGEVVLNCLWAVGMFLFLIFFPTPIKELGVLLFWVFAGVLITINVARSVSSNPGAPILSFIIGMGKAPAAILAVFFMWTSTSRTAIRQNGESDVAYAVRDVGAKMQGWATAGVLYMVLAGLINGDRVRARRKGYNPYSHSFDRGYVYN